MTLERTEAYLLDMKQMFNKIIKFFKPKPLVKWWVGRIFVVYLIIASLTAFSILFVTVPSFGFGINPFGPNTFPNFESFIIIEGVHINF